MAKGRRLNKRLEASHVRLYGWMLDSPAYLSLGCPARAVLVEIAKVYDGFAGRSSVRKLQAWLRKHPEVMRYVVLDNDDDCLDELPLFQPSSKTGLTPGIAKGIEDYLAGRSDKDMRANAITRLGQNIHALFGRDKS